MSARAIATCPFCYDPLMPHSLHACDWMEATILPRVTRRRWERIAQIASAAIIIFAIVYFSAHVLVYAGVPCTER